MSLLPNQVIPNTLRGKDQALPNNIFSVAIGGLVIGSFTKVEGLGYSVEPFEINEGGRNHGPHHRPFKEPGKAGEVRLVWGAVKRGKMHNWIHSVVPGYPFRRNVFITQHNRIGAPFRIITLLAAWPKQWQMADLDSNANELATESLTLVHEGILVVGL